MIVTIQVFLKDAYERPDLVACARLTRDCSADRLGLALPEIRRLLQQAAELAGGRAYAGHVRVSLLYSFDGVPGLYETWSPNPDLAREWAAGSGAVLPSARTESGCLYWRVQAEAVSLPELSLAALPSSGRPLSELYRLWDEFADVPVSDGTGETVADALEERFHSFEAGTPREEVWRWFESQNKDFVVGNVQQGIRLGCALDG